MFNAENNTAGLVAELRFYVDFLLKKQLPTLQVSCLLGMHNFLYVYSKTKIKQHGIARLSEKSVKLIYSSADYFCFCLGFEYIGARLRHRGLVIAYSHLSSDACETYKMYGEFLQQLIDEERSDLYERMAVLMENSSGGKRATSHRHADSGAGPIRRKVRVVARQQCDDLAIECDDLAIEVMPGLVSVIPAVFAKQVDEAPDTSMEMLEKVQMVGGEEKTKRSGKEVLSEVSYPKMDWLREGCIGDEIVDGKEVAEEGFCQLLWPRLG